MASKIYTPIAWSNYKVIQKANHLVEKRVKLVETGETFSPTYDLSMNGFKITNVEVDPTNESSAANVSYVENKLQGVTSEIGLVNEQLENNATMINNNYQAVTDELQLVNEQLVNIEKPASHSVFIQNANKVAIQGIMDEFIPVKGVLIDSRYLSVTDGNVVVNASGFYTINVGVVHDGVSDLIFSVFVDKTDDTDAVTTKLIDNLLVNSNRSFLTPITFEGGEVIKFKIEGGEDSIDMHELQLNAVISKLH